MSRRLVFLGTMLLVATIGLWLAGALDMIPVPEDDRWSKLTLEAGMVALAAALVLRVLSPIARAVGTGRCAVCGNATERGHTYCLDHMHEAMNAYRDRTREATTSRPRPRPRTRPPAEPPIHPSSS